MAMPARKVWRAAGVLEVHFAGAQAPEISNEDGSADEEGPARMVPVELRSEVPMP